MLTRRNISPVNRRVAIILTTTTADPVNWHSTAPGLQYLPSAKHCILRGSTAFIWAAQHPILACSFWAAAEGYYCDDNYLLSSSIGRMVDDLQSGLTACYFVMWAYDWKRKLARCLKTRMEGDVDVRSREWLQIGIMILWTDGMEAITTALNRPVVRSKRRHRSANVRKVMKMGLYDDWWTGTVTVRGFYVRSRTKSKIGNRDLVCQK